MPLQSHNGRASCIRRTASFNTSSSGAPDAMSVSISDLRSSRSPVFSLIDGVLSYMKHHPPMITPPQRDVSKPHSPVGAVREPPKIDPLSGEDPRRVPHENDAGARGVLCHADQLPAVARPLVDRLLQCRLRGEALAGVQRRVLRVVALVLRAVWSLPLMVAHVLPPHFDCSWNFP